MRIENLIKSSLNEKAQFVPQIYAYHATGIKNLRSILKNGLVPNFKKDGYGSNEKDSDFGYSLDALNGIYFTSKPSDVEHIAKSIDEQPIIIICKVQNRTATLDEDRFSSSIIQKLNIPNKIRTVLKQNKNLSDMEEMQLSDRLSNELTTEIINELSPKVSKDVINNVKNDIFQYMKLLIRNFLQHFDDVYYNNYVKELQTKITNKLKNLLHSDQKEQYSFKINTTIGFSGSNKIVGIYDFNQGIGWGDLSYFERDAYHKVKTPSELLKNNA